MKKVKNYHHSNRFYYPGSSCPQKDQSCVASDDSNIITIITTSDDSECGGKQNLEKLAYWILRHWPVVATPYCLST